MPCASGRCLRPSFPAYYSNRTALCSLSLRPQTSCPSFSQPNAIDCQPNPTRSLVSRIDHCPFDPYFNQQSFLFPSTKRPMSLKNNRDLIMNSHLIIGFEDQKVDEGKRESGGWNQLGMYHLQRTCCWGFKAYSLGLYHIPFAGSIISVVCFTLVHVVASLGVSPKKVRKNLLSLNGIEILGNYCS